MKKLFMTLATAALILSGCSNDRDEIPQIKGNALRVTKVETEVSDDAKAEVEKIGKDGFRLLEYDAETKNLLQQTVWKNNEGQWAPESEPNAVMGNRVVAVYPASEAQTEAIRLFKAGQNNMISVQDVDRTQTNEALVAFKHEMCQIAFDIKDQNGKVVKIGKENGQISSITMEQPVNVSYNMFEGTVEKLGETKAATLSAEAVNYVIPGGDSYIVRAVYKNSEGKEISFSYTPDFEPVKNKKYNLHMKMDTEEETPQMEVTVGVEEWEVEKIDLDLNKDEEDEPSGEFMEFVNIPAGSFMMGSPDALPEAWANEKPQHQVNISAFKMGKYEVTFDQYDAYCEETGAERMSDNEWGRGNRPVIGVSWNEANEFCEWLSKKLGGTVRLPTEAEWEYACRAGTTTKFFWGQYEDGFEDYCWCATNVGWQGPTQPVGQKKPNAWGLYDMSGNVEEWCSDWISWNYSWCPKESTDPTGPASPQVDEDDGTEYYEKVYRGGSYYTTNRMVYSAKRASGNPEPMTRRKTVGFRVVMEISAETPVEPEDPVKVYKEGDEVPAGVYVAYVDNNVKYAVSKEDYEADKNFLGALVSDGTNMVILSAKNGADNQEITWANKMEDIEGVVQADIPGEAIKDFAGKANHAAIMKWAAVEGNEAPAAEKASEYVVAGVNGWYLPSAGELNMAIKNIDAVNEVLALAGKGNYDKLAKETYMWTSTIYDDEKPWCWHAWWQMFNCGSGKDKKLNIRPVHSFQVETPVEPEEPEVPEIQGAYKQGDKVPAGYYIAFVKDGYKYAMNKEQFTVATGTPFGALVSDGEHQFVVSPRYPATSYTKWQNPSDELIEGVFTPQGDTASKQHEEALKDFDGRKNTDAMLKWAAAKSGRKVPAAESADTFEYQGVNDWYLPALGELNKLMSDRDEINPILAMCPEYRKIKVETDYNYWSSTQRAEKACFIWYGDYGCTFDDYKSNYCDVRPVTSF